MYRPDPASRPVVWRAAATRLARAGLRTAAAWATVLLLVLGARLQAQTDNSIVSVTAPGAPSVLSAGDTISIVLTFTEAVDAMAGSSFPLNSGGTAYLVGSPTGVTTLTFSYTVGPTDTTGGVPLDVQSADTIPLSDITTDNSADQPLAWPWPSPALAPAGILLGPQVVSIVCSGATPTNQASGSVQFTVTYSEPVTTLTASDFTAVTSSALTLGAPVFGTLVMTNPQTVQVPVNFSVQAGQTATLGLSATGGQDAAGNTLVAGTPAINQSYTFDTTVPTVTSFTLASPSPSNGFAGHLLSWQVVFSEPVTAPTSANLVLTGDLGTPSYTITPAGPATTYSITLNALPTGNSGSVGLTLQGTSTTLKNAVGTALTASASAPAFTIDQTAPVISAITPLTPNPTNGLGSNAPIFQVTFSKPVSGVTAAEFGVTPLGTPATMVAALTPSSGLSAIYQLTLTAVPAIAAAPPVGTLTVTAPASSSIVDAAGNTLNTSASGSCAIIQTPPTVTAIQLTAADPSNGQGLTPLTFQVTFSEPVSGVTGGLSGSFNAMVGGSLSAATAISVSPSPTARSAVFSVTVAEPSTGTAGSVGLTVNLAGIIDAYGNSLAAGSPSPNQSYTVIQTQPTVTAIQTSAATPTNGQGATPLTFQVSFSAPVVGVTGGLSGSFSAMIGGSLAAASAITVSPSPTTSSSIFSVTVALPDNGGSGSVGLNLVVAGIKDIYGNSLAAAAPSPNQSYTVIQTQPTVASILTTGANPTNGQGATPLTFQVSFSAPVVGVTGGLSGSFSAVIGGSLAPASAITVSPNPTTSSSVFSVTVALPNNGASGAVGLNLVVAGIKDAYGNSLVAATPSPNQIYNVSQLRPTLTTLVAINPLTTSGVGATALQFLATFSTAVSGVAAGDFTATFGGSNISASAVSAQGSATYLVTFPSLTANQGFSGSYTAFLTGAGGITDALGNVLTASGLNASYTINQTAPVVTAITLLSANPGTAQLQFQVQFSQVVGGVVLGDFTPVLGNGLAASASATVIGLAPSNGSSSQYTVTLSSLTATAPATGTLGLGLSSVAGITDSLGNAAVAATPSPNQFYSISPPVITSISCLFPNPNPAPGPVDYLVVFSTPVTGISVTNFPFTVSPPEIVSIDAQPTISILSPTSCSVQIGGITLGSGYDSAPLPLVFNATNGTTVRDALGNIALNTLPNSPNAAYTITTEQPVLILLGQPVTFQEGAVVTPITVFDCTSFTDTGATDFVSGIQQGTIDATIFTPVLNQVAPRTISSDPLDELGIQPAAGDHFSVINQATSPNGATSGTLQFSGQTIGTFTYTSTQRNLHIILTSTTTTTQVQTLINDIVFANLGDNPSNSNRQVFLSVTDGNGKSSATYTQNVAVSLYNNTTPLITGVPEISAMPPPRIVQPGQAITQQHILTNDVDSFFVTSLYNANNILVTPVNEATILTLPTAKGVVTISLYGDWSYTANTGVSGEDTFTLNIADIGPGKGQFVGGDALLAPVNVVQQIYIVPSSYIASSPSITSNPPVEAELGSSFDYVPVAIPGIDPALVVSTYYDIVDQDGQGFVAAGDFVIDPLTGEVSAGLVPTPSDGYIQFAILLEVTDTSGVTRGTYQPVVLKVVSATSGGG